jgi:TRAP-type C4-dicarboxylate transport system permease small subunit
MLQGTLDTLQSKLDSIYVVTFTIATATLFGTQFLISSNAIGRYLFDSPIRNTVDIVTLVLIIVIVFFSIAKLDRDDGNVNVNIFYQRMSERARRTVDLLYNVLVFFLFMYVLRGTTLTAIDYTQRGSSTAGGVPTFYSWWVITIGLILLCIQLLVNGGMAASDLFGDPEERGSDG